MNETEKRGDSPDQTRKERVKLLARERARKSTLAADRGKRAKLLAENKARRRALTAANGGIAPVAVHNASTYANWGCRCKFCLDTRGYKRHRIKNNEQKILLDRLRPKLYKVAASLTQHDDFIEELAQEGWIAVWREITDKGRLLPDSVLVTHARNKMLNIIRYNTQQCRDINKTRADGLPTQNIENHGTDAEVPSVWIKLQCDLGAIELAYHRGEIAKALDTLTPIQREYVVLKFWHGLSHAELVAHFGYKPAHLWQRSKATLEKELAHLGVN